jgi:hypothetical protein
VWQMAVTDEQGEADRRDDARPAARHPQPLFVNLERHSPLWKRTGLPAMAWSDGIVSTDRPGVPVGYYADRMPRGADAEMAPIIVVVHVRS